MTDWTYDKNGSGMWEPVSDGYPDPLRDFHEGQWWVAELDAFARSDAATDDQKRAVAVVHHMLLSATAEEAALNDAYAEGRKDEREANEWQPIETAPKDGTTILVYSGRFAVEAWFSESWDHFVNSMTGGTHLLDPTHWMPLPAAPVLGGPQ